MQKILDVGCGQAKTFGAIGIDRIQMEGVDIVCDINEKWPVEDDSFDVVLFRHSISHVKDIMFVLWEAKRVCKRGGIVKIIAPHFSSDNTFTDPTVNYFIGYRTFNYFCCNTKSLYTYYSDLDFILEGIKITFYRLEPKGLLQKMAKIIFWPFDIMINIFPRIYEKFFCFIFRANEIMVVLRVK